MDTQSRRIKSKECLVTHQFKSQREIVSFQASLEDRSKDENVREI